MSHEANLRPRYAGTQLPTDGLSEVAFFGRSNAGKSTLINRLAGQAGLARVGKLPGKTRYRHFFRIGELLYFVDLPGYGYSTVPESERAAWVGLVDDYVHDRSELVAGVLVVDARRFATELDQTLSQWWADRHGGPLLVAACKADKLGQRELAALKRDLCGVYRIDQSHCFAVSSRTPAAVDALRRTLFALARQRPRGVEHAPQSYQRPAHG